MKRSIKHLPKRTQEELEVLFGLIQQHILKWSMIVLYGSYARGGYVLWDERVEFGVNTSYQSDYDIMIVCSPVHIKYIEDRLRTKVTPKYHHAFEHRRHASPQFIVEDINKLNRNLKRAQYFYTDIIKEGIKVYDNKKFKLTKPQELSYKDIKEIAVDEFEMVFPIACDYLNHGYFGLKEKRYVTGSFQLHQACEKLYNAITLVFANRRPKNHKLIELYAMTKEFSRELATVFPLNTDFEKRCFQLLCDAYIQARYNKDFVVTKEEFEYMLARVEIFKTITNRICNERIEFYDALIKREKA